MNAVVYIPILIVAAGALLLWRRPKFGWMPAEAAKQVQRERRRPPRIPVVINVELKANTRSVTATSKNVAPGGMLLTPIAPLSVGEPLGVAFTLPDGTSLEIPAVVCRKQGNDFAVKFDVTDQRRGMVERWVMQHAAHA